MRRVPLASASLVCALALVGRSQTSEQPVLGVAERMQRAEQLASAGQSEEALSELLWCFDEGAKQDPAFMGVRLSFLPMQIARLGEKFPPATKALEERQATAEARAAAAKGGSAYPFALMELVALNHSLGRHESNLAIYDELRGEQPDSPLIPFVRSNVANELVRLGRGDEPEETSQQDSVQPEPAVVARRPGRARPRGDDPRGQVDSTPTSVPYKLDSVAYARELGATNDRSQRLKLLSQRWDDIVLAVTYCDVATGMSFHNSVRFWQMGWLSTGSWTLRSEDDLIAPQSPAGKASVLVEGDCRSDLVVNGMLHIYGDLHSTVTLGGQSELVVGGDVRPGGRIETDGIARVFIGGNVAGQISNKGSSKIWIHGSLDGEVLAGTPSTNLYIMGDFRGDLKPFGPPALAYLDVRGSMPSDRMQAVTRRKWTEFSASIGSSDVPAGLYPKEREGNAFWVVHSTNP